MPEMDGYETCRQLKASPVWRDLPIIFLTAKTETADIVRGFELGAVDYVGKPFNAHELLARVRTHLTIDRLNKENTRLLLNVLPAPIAEQLKKQSGIIAERFEDVSVLFADIAGFTILSRGMPPEPLVEMLNDLFTRFDELARSHGVEKIKTIGDCYMAVCGVPERRADHAAGLADMALEMLTSLRAFNQTRGIATRNSHRSEHRPGRRRGHRPQQVHLRSVGRHGEHGQPHGIERPPRPHPGDRGDAAGLAAPLRARRTRRGGRQRQRATPHLVPRGARLRPFAILECMISRRRGRR